MSFKNDSCFLNQTNKSNKSILDYTLDTSAFINKNECSDFTPTFLSYIPTGTKEINIDLENELRGSIRTNSKCVTCKFKPGEEHVHTNDFQVLKNQKIDTEHIKQECKKEFKILPNGYFGYF